MSFRSIHTINFLCGTSIIALVGTGCLIMETAEAGQTALNQQLTVRGVNLSNANSTDVYNRRSSRGISRTSVQKRIIKPKAFSNARRLNEKGIRRTIKVINAPAIGHPRLAIGRLDKRRIEKLAKGKRERGFGRIVNITSAGTKKKANAAPVETPLSLNYERIKGKKARKLTSKPVHPKYKLPRATVTSYQVNAAADDKPTTRQTDLGIKFEGKSVVRHLDIPSNEQPLLSEIALGGVDTSVLLNMRDGKNWPQTKKDGTRKGCCGNYRPQFFFRTSNPKGFGFVQASDSGDAGREDVLADLSGSFRSARHASGGSIWQMRSGTNLAGTPSTRTADSDKEHTPAFEISSFDLDVESQISGAVHHLGIRLRPTFMDGNEAGIAARGVWKSPAGVQSPYFLEQMFHDIHGKTTTGDASSSSTIGPILNRAAILTRNLKMSGETTARVNVIKPQPIIFDEPGTTPDDPGGTGSAPCTDPLKHAPGC